MKSVFRNLVACGVALLVTVAAFAGQAAEIKLKDGSKWRGQVSDTVELRYMQQGVEVPLSGKLLKVEDLYVQVEAVIAGKVTNKTVFKSDIVSMKTTEAGADAATPIAPSAGAAGGVTAPAAKPTPERPGVKTKSTDSPLGVFVLPLDGGVGETFRHEEIKMMGEYLDKNYPPGQILILQINSNGGSSFESQKIAETIFDIKKRHRVIAWIHKAISAGCQTAMCCNEIYFMTEGTAGSVTTWNPGSGQSIKGQDLADAMEDLARIAELGGRSKYIAYAMKTNSALLSYDKDPVTGEVTFYNDLSGKYVLSDEKSNLCFNSQNALDCGFSDGTADTTDDLAKLLNMPKWNELSDYGRKIAKDWTQTCERAQEEIPVLIAQMSYKNSTGDAIEVLGTRIQLLLKLEGWLQRCPNVAQARIPPKEVLDREIAELRKQIADMKKRQ